MESKADKSYLDLHFDYLNNFVSASASKWYITLFSSVVSLIPNEKNVGRQRIGDKTNEKNIAAA